MFYNSIYIGSGPLNIISASLESKQGKNVAIIEEKDHFGGAWKTINVGDFGDFEIGCHIWSYNKKGYNFMTEVLGIDLTPMDPQPIFMTKNTRIKYDHKNFYLNSKRLVGHILSGRFKETRAFILDPNSRIPIFPRNHKYTKNGRMEEWNSMKP